MSGDTLRRLVNSARDHGTLVVVVLLGLPPFLYAEDWFAPGRPEEV